MSVTNGRGGLPREMGRGGVAVKWLKLPILARAAVLAGHCCSVQDTDGASIAATVFGRKSLDENMPLEGGGALPARKPIELSNQFVHCEVPGRDGN